MAVALASAAPAGAAESSGPSRAEIDARYLQLLEAERERTSDESFTSQFASGLAALGIGLYGYYNDNQGILTRVVYSATQTAGVVMMSNAILDVSQPSMLLLADRYLGRGKDLNLDRYKRAVVLIDQRRAVAEYKQLAYTSAVLSGIYGYSAYRERSNEESLKNAFLFLSFNFALISAANLYRLATFDSHDVADTRSYRTYSRIALLPFPTYTYWF